MLCVHGRHDEPSPLSLRQCDIRRSPDEHDCMDMLGGEFKAIPFSLLLTFLLLVERIGGSLVMITLFG